MPRGVPKAGFRRTKKRMAAAVLSDVSTPVSKDTNETDVQIWEKISDRFEVLEQLTKASMKGISRSLVVSGPAGLGKSFTVEKMLREWDPEEKKHIIIKGYVKATGLYKMLYQYRHKNNVIVFDDSDTIFNDETALNMLKAVCDTTERRQVSYLADYKMVDEDSANMIPNTFTFEGSVVFITNLDFHSLIDRGHKIACHLQALMSRSHYVDLAMKTRRDYIVRIRQVIKQGLLKNRVSELESARVMKFIENNSDSLTELSLRVPIKISDLMRSSPNSWEKIAKVTMFKVK
jgi:hypothetical protein